jgi:hypothetical protein
MIKTELELILVALAGAGAALRASYSDTKSWAHLSGHSRALSLSARCFIAFGRFVSVHDFASSLPRAVVA